MIKLCFAATLSIGVAIAVGIHPSIAASNKASGPRALVGNTIHEIDPVDGELWDYYRPDGTGAGLAASGERNQFTWTINGNELCRTYSDPPVECSTFEFSGNSGVEASVSGNEVGQRVPFELIRGNPKGL